MTTLPRTFRSMLPDLRFAFEFGWPPIVKYRTVAGGQHDENGVLVEYRYGLRTLHITAISARDRGNGHASRCLDGLPTDRRIVVHDVINPILEGMLQRRGFEPRGWVWPTGRPRRWVRRAGAEPIGYAARGITDEDLAYYRGQPSPEPVKSEFPYRDTLRDQFGRVIPSTREACERLHCGDSHERGSFGL